MVPSRRRPGAVTRLLRRRHRRRLPDPRLRRPRRRQRPQSRLRYRPRPCPRDLPGRLPHRPLGRRRGHPLPRCRQSLRRPPLPRGRPPPRRRRSLRPRRAPTIRQGQPPRPLPRALPLRLPSPHPCPLRPLPPPNRAEPSSILSRSRPATGSVVRALAGSVSGGACRVPFARGPRPRRAAFLQSHICTTRGAIASLPPPRPAFSRPVASHASRAPGDRSRYHAC